MTPQFTSTRAQAIGLFLSPALCLVSCDQEKKQALMSEMEQTKIELTHRVELEKYRFAKIDTGEVAELARLQALTNQNTGVISEIKLRKSTAQALVASLEDRFAKLREVTIAERRRAAHGTTYETLRLVSGRQFEKVSIISIDDAGVAIRHAAGSARLRYSDLDQQQRVLFGIEADSASVALAKETEAAKAYDKQISSEIATIQQKQAAADSIKASARIASARETSQPVVVAMNDLVAPAAPKVRELAQPAVAVGSGSRRYYGYSNNRYSNNGGFVTYYNVVPYYNNVQPLFGPNPNMAPGTYIAPNSQYQQTTFSSPCAP
jgi:hypothetical protein